MFRMQEMAFPCFKFQIFFPIHAWYVGHTRGLQPLLCSSNILCHRKVPYKKMPPPVKSLKKAMPDFVLSPLLVFRWLEFRSVPPDKTYPLLVSFEVFGIIWKIMKRYTLRKLCVHTTDTTIGPSDARSAIMFSHFGLLVMKY